MIFQEIILRNYNYSSHCLCFSGGNDNKLFVWNLSSQTPMQTYTDHLAAVKVRKIIERAKDQGSRFIFGGWIIILLGRYLPTFL